MWVENVAGGNFVPYGTKHFFEQLFFYPYFVPNRTADAMGKKISIYKQHFCNMRFFTKFIVAKNQVNTGFNPAAV